MFFGMIENCSLGQPQRWPNSDAKYDIWLLEQLPNTVVPNAKSKYLGTAHLLAPTPNSQAE
jgi:hypothetical protein